MFVDIRDGRMRQGFTQAAICVSGEKGGMKRGRMKKHERGERGA